MVESKNKTRRMMMVFVLVQGILLVALLATLQHAAKEKKTSFSPEPVASLRGNTTEPPAIDLSGEGPDELEDEVTAPVVQDEEEVEEEDDEESKDLQTLFADEESSLLDSEDIALEHAANAETKEQQDAFLMEAQVLQTLETTEELEAQVYADLENPNLDSQEEEHLEKEAEALSKLEDNLYEQADLLEKAGQTEEKAKRKKLVQKVQALQEKEEELKEKNQDLPTNEERNALEDGS